MYIILILMAGIIAMVLVVALIFLGLGTINQDTGDTLPQTITISSRSTPVPRPTFTTVQTPSNQDPIIGSWLNGMVFFANGTVGSDGKTSWRANENENNSYFVISDTSSEMSKNSGFVSSTEWVYNPSSDKINKRGSSEAVSRGIPKPVPTTVPAITTMKTQPIQGQNTTNVSGTPKKFSYSDCIEICKSNYWADHHIGYYNDCLNTCNIENLKSSN
jgi:hypothetical protein